MPNYHVTMKGPGQWQYKREGADRAAGFTKTQKEAEELAKQTLAKQGGGEVRIHSPNGLIRDSDTVRPGNDPTPPIDTKH